MVLHVRGEQEYVVPPLAPPDADGPLALAALVRNPSVQLFVQRARVTNPPFAVTESNAAAVRDVCRRLDGLPLAIELAAARVKVLSPQAMLARLQHRLELLRGGARDLPARQQALRTAIDWSYELLESAERMLFARLAVFVGGCSLAEVEEVCRPPDLADVDALDGIASLVDKSLVLRHEGADGEPRFTMLETIREYALERLAESGEEQVIRRQHAAYFLAFAETTISDAHGQRQPEWPSRLELEHDNLRAALQWFEDSGESQGLVELAAALSDFWRLRGHLMESRARMTRLLRSPAMASRTALRAKALVIAGGLAYHHLDIASAWPLYTEVLSIQEELGITEERDVVLHVLGTAAHHLNDHAAARDYLERSYALRREWKDVRGMAQSLNDLANLAHEEGDFVRARALFEQCLAIYRSLDGSVVWVALVLNNLAILAQDEGDLPRARALLEESVAAHRDAGDPRGLALALANLARVTAMQGDCRQAEVSLAESIRLEVDIGDRAGIAFVVDRFAMVAGLRGQAERCLLLAGAASVIRDGLGVARTTKPRTWLEQQLMSARQRLGEAAANAAWTAGRALSADGAIALALSNPIDAPPTEDSEPPAFER